MCQSAKERDLCEERKRHKDSFFNDHVFCKEIGGKHPKFEWPPFLETG